MQQGEIVEVIALVAVYWPGLRVPHDEAEQDVMVGAWGRLLGDLDQQTAVAAVESIAVDGERFAPQPGQIRARALELTTRESIPDVDVAWGEVTKAISRYGHTTPVGQIPWSHPAIHGAVDALGWQRICASTDLMVDRAHFIRFYGKAHARAVFEAVMPPSVRALTAGLAERLSLDRVNDA